MTPAYASPQMLDGQDPEPSDDVFALAIVAYELMAGRHPFEREPADARKTDAVKMDRLPGLTRSQTRALIKALSPERASRHASAREFLEEFGHSRAVRTVAVSAVVAVAAIGVLAVAALRDVEPRPDVPLEDLAADVRADLRQQLDEGRRALDLGDIAINDAYQHFTNAFALHRYNDEAMQGLRDVADRLLNTIPTMDVGTQRDAFELLVCQEYLATYEPVGESCSALLGAECAAIASRCGA
jgi:serine/threonine protein kinase